MTVLVEAADRFTVKTACVAAVPTWTGGASSTEIVGEDTEAKPASLQWLASARRAGAIRWPMLGLATLQIGLADIITRGSTCSTVSRRSGFRDGTLRLVRGPLRPVNTFPNTLSKIAMVGLLRKMFRVSGHPLYVLYRAGFRL